MEVLRFLRSAGPTTFFLAMAILPAIGAPLSFFCLTAGSVFAPQLGMPAVILLSLAAIAANMALSHLLARRALRPPLGYLVSRLGYQLPPVKSGDVTDLIVLLRVTPGLPFPVQNYLLGLAAVPFIRYFVVSCLIAFPLNAAIIFFGEALLQGRGRMALIGLLLVSAAMAGLHLLRRHYRARQQA
ncbi:MAG: VTT domain-containing protein [Pseudomonadota bacterium]|nr:VTT domain-containing protein [Pseudomonadota bacterium]